MEGRIEFDFHSGAFHSIMYYKIFKKTPASYHYP